MAAHQAPDTRSRRRQLGLWGGTCLVVIALYACLSHSGVVESLSPGASETYYNLLVRGFRAGHLSLDAEVPPGLAALPDPYDPAANSVYLSAAYRMLDLSYYKGRLYLYFGITPALILFWPFAALTDHYLFQRQAVAIFCVVGFLVSAGIFRALWRQCFAGVSSGIAAAGIFALGLANGIPILLSRSDVYEVPISCGYMLTMLSLGAIWRALQEPERRWKWLLAASAAYGLALGARPSLLFGAVVLLLPVVHVWRERQRIWIPLLAVVSPILFIGLGLLYYNYLRFGNPFEFGQHYQLAFERQSEIQHFSLRYLWFNLRVYFLKSVGWRQRFPFLQDMAVSSLPRGHGGLESPFGILTNVPLAWFALAVPLAWRTHSNPAGPILREFVVAVILLFAIGALTICFYYCVCCRFEIDFLPALMLLAVIGILEVECATADHVAWRRASRCCWGGLLVFSVAFNLLATVQRRAETEVTTGLVLMRVGRVPEAVTHFEKAVGVSPDFAEAYNVLGAALAQEGRLKEAIENYRKALRINPDYAQACNNLGTALIDANEPRKAIGQFQKALRLQPDSAEASYGLGVTLLRLGRAQEAIGPLQHALNRKPHWPEAQYVLGLAFEQLGNVPEAVEHYEQALKLRPDDAEIKDRLARLRANK